MSTPARSLCSVQIFGRGHGGWNFPPGVWDTMSIAPFQDFPHPNFLPEGEGIGCLDLIFPRIFALGYAHAAPSVREKQHSIQSFISYLQQNSEPVQREMAGVAEQGGEKIGQKIRGMSAAVMRGGQVQTSRDEEQGSPAVRPSPVAGEQGQND